MTTSLPIAEDAWARRRLGPFEISTWMGLGIVVAAALLRVALLPSARFGGDEARDFRIAAEIVAGNQFPALGAQITDGKALLPGPAFYYVLALPLLVSRTPEAQFLFIELLGAASVGLFWAAMRRPFGEKGAAFGALLLALSPWAALYADRTWNPNVLPFFVFLALYAAVRLREDPRSPWLAVFLPAAAVMPHFHMSAPVAWLGLLPLVAATVPRWRKKWVLVGLALCLALYLPLIGHEIATGLQNTKNLLAETLGAKKEKHEGSAPWVPVYLLRFLTLDITYHENTGYWGGPNEWKNVASLWKGTAPRPFHPLRFFALLVSLGLAAWALGLALVQAIRRGREQGWTRAVTAWGWALCAALVGNTLLIAATGKQVFGHYVVLMLPFAFVLYANLGASALSRPRLRVVALALAAVFCAGGAEAAILYSRRVDGRLGLHVHRASLERIYADMDREGLPKDEPVRLDFGYHAGNTWHWDIYARYALERPVRWDRRAKRLIYKLVPAGTAMPEKVVKEGPIDLDMAWMYRLK